MSEIELFQKKVNVPSRPGILQQIADFCLPFLIIGLVWEFAVRVGWIQLASLPAPTVILGELWQIAVVKGLLWQHMFASLYRLAVGYLLAVLIGTTVGALLSLNPLLNTLFKPTLSLLISVPTIAWVPVLLILTGLGDRTVILTVFLGGFFAITYNTMRGIEMVPKNLVNASRLMGVSGVQLFFKVLLPGSLVSIINGLRLGIGYSWRALVGGEMLAAMIEWGIGKMVYDARFWNDINLMFAGIIVIGLSGVLLDRTLLTWFESLTVEKWGMLSRR